MKKMMKAMLFGLILSCAFVFNAEVEAATIKESTDNYDKPMFILGSTRFDSSEVLSADAVLEAGFNHAKVKAALGEDISNLDYKPQVYYYDADFENWYAVKGTETPKLSESEVKELEEKLEIYFVNNEMKTIEVEYSGEVDEVLTEGVTYDGTKFKVPALTPVVEFTANGKGVEVTVNENHTAVDEKAVIEVNGIYFVKENIKEALGASTKEKPAMLLKDVDLPTAVEVTTKAIIDLNGYNLTVREDTAGDGVFHVLKGGDLTINGEGTIDGVGNNKWNIAIFADGGKVTINGGTYTNENAPILDDDTDSDHFDLIYSKGEGSEVVINGGRFLGKTPAWLLNLSDNSGASIVVKGGTFVGFNPADNEAEGKGTNFVAPGYKVVKKDGEYTVVEVSDEIVVNGNSLQEIVNNAVNGSVINITKDMDLPTAVEITKKVTIELNGHALTVRKDTAGDGVFHVLKGGDLTINGEGTIDGVGDNKWNIAIFAHGGKVTINGGTYTNENIVVMDDDTDSSHFDLIYSKGEGSEVVINGGRFLGKTPAWLLNLSDNSGASIVVKGGTFVGFNPADNKAEGKGTNFVAEGYKSVLSNGEYTVVKNS